jgi:hypothetical protein|tara:strand:+ start:3560 stop:3733 length:174 start_codon:yes stop_codon:yes gene_type:complete
MIQITETLNYLDPGTGSYLYQVLIAAGVTVGLYFKNLKFFITNIIDNVKNKSNKKES